MLALAIRIIMFLNHSLNFSREDSRYDHNGPTPPRFANNESRHGGPYGYGDRRHRGSSGRGQNRINPPGSGRAYKDQSSKKVPSAEYNEEWETASEGSDNLSCGIHQKKEPPSREIQLTSDKQESKKSFSNQRRGPRRRGNHGGDPPNNSSGRLQDGGAGMVNDRECPEKGPDPHRRPNDRQDSVEKSSNNKPSGSNGAVQAVYRLDQVVYNDPLSIQRAMSSAARRLTVHLFSLLSSVYSFFYFLV